jgi:hypothetical protein
MKGRPGKHPAKKVAVGKTGEASRRNQTCPHLDLEPLASSTIEN